MSNLMFTLFEQGTCGYFDNPDPSGSGCCIVSLDLLDYGNYMSSMDNFLGNNWDLANSPPLSANGNSYCMIQTNNSASTDWNIAYYLDSSQCIDQVKCKNGKVSVYNDSKCSNLAFSATLNQTEIVAQAGYLGNVSMSYITVVNGQNAVQWTTYMPGLLLVPKHQNPIEALGLVGYILSLIFCFTSFLYYLWSFYKTRQLRALLIVLTQVLALFRDIFAMIYIYTVFTQDNVLLASIVDIGGNILVVYNLFCTLLSGSFLFKILNINSKWIIYLGYSFLTLLFVVMNGLYYYTTVILNYYTAESNLIYLEYIQYAITLRNGYITFVLIFDAIPIVILLTILFRQHVLKYQKEDVSKLTIGYKFRFLLILLFVQLLIASLYGFTSYVIDTQLFINNDRDIIGTSGTQTFMIEAHCLTVIALYEFLKFHTRELVEPQIEPREKPKMLLDMTVYSSKSNTVQEKETVRL
ncbi:hypothetical protein HK103_001787 [Boothiomyces macroporosus]|uniref:Uncharacterized protein n=1 Tax=Boothiomyces macroporosus TaxID=261099 RepID=A0AAD5Y0E8_9FUNG|nr:hypothetical protein HK103_001787 [Boothiomyces macroporosus]